jgi:hypothetical protein
MWAPRTRKKKEKKMFAPSAHRDVLHHVFQLLFVPELRLVRTRRPIRVRGVVVVDMFFAMRPQSRARVASAPVGVGAADVARRARVGRRPGFFRALGPLLLLPQHFHDGDLRGDERRGQGMREGGGQAHERDARDDEPGDGNGRDETRSAKRVAMSANLARRRTFRGLVKDVGGSGWTPCDTGRARDEDAARSRSIASSSPPRIARWARQICDEREGKFCWHLS